MEIFRRADKSRIRSHIKRARAVTPADQAGRFNEMIFSALVVQPELCAASMVYTYISVNGEPVTRRLLEHLWEQGIKTAVPKVLTQGYIDFFVIQSMTDLEPGCMGIPEPKAHCTKADGQPAVVITPGLAFDRVGNRIGYGGGYYDRFFEREPKHLRMGIAFPYQLWSTLPGEAYDQNIDRLLVAGERKVDVYEFNRDR